MSFAAAFAWLLGDEGDAFVNDPQDHGGPTKWGITQRAWSDFSGRPANADVIASLTRDDALRFYEGVYWLPLGGDALPDLVALALFDIGVLMGLNRAVKLMQCALGVTQDGIIGPVTRNIIVTAGPKKALLTFIPAVLSRFIGIVEVDPTQLVFLRAWTHRAIRLLSLIP